MNNNIVPYMNININSKQKRKGLYTINDKLDKVDTDRSLQNQQNRSEKSRKSRKSRKLFEQIEPMGMVKKAEYFS